MFFYEQTTSWYGFRFFCNFRFERFCLLTVGWRYFVFVFIFLQECSSLSSSFICLFVWSSVFKQTRTVAHWGYLRCVRVWVCACICVQHACVCEVCVNAVFRCDDLFLFSAREDWQPLGPSGGWAAGRNQCGLLAGPPAGHAAPEPYEENQTPSWAELGRWSLFHP